MPSLQYGARFLAPDDERLLLAMGAAAAIGTADIEVGDAARALQVVSSRYQARLLTLQAAWMADNSKPNSLQASMAKAKAGRVGTEIALRCVALCGATGFGEGELLEKWARDAKILDLFEGTQQIQLLIIARTLLGVSSAELK